MVNTEPLRQYLNGIEELKAGDRDAALKHLAESAGAAKPTPYMDSHLEALLKPNVAMLTLLINQTKKGE